MPRDQVAKLENTHQSTMPMGFGALPDDVFRNLIWYVLAPPEEHVWGRQVVDPLEPLQPEEDVFL